MSCLHHSNAHWLTGEHRCQRSRHSVELELKFAPSNQAQMEKHVATIRLKQTVKLVLEATKHLSVVWTAVFLQNHLVFV